MLHIVCYMYACVYIGTKFHLTPSLFLYSASGCKELEVLSKLVANETGELIYTSQSCIYSSFEVHACVPECQHIYSIKYKLINVYGHM